MTIWNDIKELLKGVFQKGFFNLLSANILIQVIAFASQLFVAGILSPEDIGRIKILQTWLGIFSIIGSMGFNSSTLKLCSENRTKEESQRIFKHGIFFTLVTTIGSYILVLIINQLGLIAQEKITQSLIPLALLPFISTSLFSLYISYHQANKKIKLISNLIIINKFLSVFLIISFTYYLGITGYYIGYNVGIATILLAAILITKLSKSSRIQPLFSQKYFKLHWEYARPSFFSNILAELSAYADILLINFLITDIYGIGQYSFALTLTILYRMLPTTVQQITIPYFSSLSNNYIEFSRTYKRYSHLLILIIIVCLILGIFLIPQIINLIFDGKYIDSIQFFIPLSIGWSIRQYNQIQSSALFGVGKIGYIANSQFITLLFNITVIFISIHLWGLIGASYASIICSTFTVLLLSYYLKKTKKA